MTSDAVQQTDALSDLFGEVLRYAMPESVAVLGVAGGNGLEQIDSTVTRRVCGIDVNPRYLDATRERFRGLPGLELHCMDVSKPIWEVAPVDLVHAALIFEHTGLECCLENAVRLVAGGGSFSVVLQLPSDQQEGVGVNSRPSIQTLRERFRLIEPVRLERELEGDGFQIVRRVHRPLASGKGFWMGVFQRAGS